MVTIPPGVQEGRCLRLKGLRKQGNGGEGGRSFPRHPPNRLASHA